jgi:hypothetical protein
LKDFLHVWLLLSVLVCAGGCKHFEARPLSGNHAADAFECRSLSDSGLRAFMGTNLPDTTVEWPRKTWDLPSLTLAAFYYHPSLELARAQWRVTQGEIKTASGRPNPSVTAGPGYNFNAPQGVNPWLPFVNFDLPVETAGKRGQATHEPSQCH